MLVLLCFYQVSFNSCCNYILTVYCFDAPYVTFFSLLLPDLYLPSSCTLDCSFLNSW
jgi:hypothetical protein